MKALLMYFFISMVNPVNNTNPEKPSVHQEISAVISTDMVVSTPQGEVTLRAGTPVVVETVQTLNAKNLSEGQTVSVRVKYNVVVSKHTVVAAGALGNATVSEVQRPGMFGKAGKVELQIQSIQAVDGQQVLVSGMAMIAEGQNRKVLAWSLAIGLFFLTIVGGAIGFFIKGKNAEMRAGTSSNVSVASDAQVDLDEK
jgi:hypothetical protein